MLFSLRQKEETPMSACINCGAWECVDWCFWCQTCLDKEEYIEAQISQEIAQINKGEANKQTN